MKYFLIIMNSLMLLFMTHLPLLADPSLTSSDKRLDNLTEHFNAFTAYWDRFRIGGDITIKSSSAYVDNLHRMESMNFKQQLDLFLDARVDPTLSLAVKLFHSGGWGQNYQNVSASSAPMATPLQLDEAFFRMEKPNAMAYLGRFKFAPTPLGLIADFSINPAEGITLQKVWNNFHGIALYSRINTEYQTGADHITTAEDYWAVRLGWSDGQRIIGLNFVPNGISGEKNIGMDWSVEHEGRKFAMETALYSFYSAKYPLYMVDWSPGVLLRYGQTSASDNYWEVKIGYFSPNFIPSYSSLAHCSGDNREWFFPNSQGIEFSTKNQFRPGWYWENRLFYSQPVTKSTDTSDLYRLSSSIRKMFSPINQLQLGVDRKEKRQQKDTSIFITWNIQF